MITYILLKHKETSIWDVWAKAAHGQIKITRDEESAIIKFLLGE